MDKSTFDTLLQKMLKTPPLPKAEIKTKRKSKKRKKTAALELRAGVIRHQPLDAPIRHDSTV